MESLKVRIEKMVSEYQYKIDDQDRLLGIQEQETSRLRKHGTTHIVTVCLLTEQKLRSIREVYVQTQKDIECFLDYA